MNERAHAHSLLPDGVTVLERGWLSSNNTVLQGRFGRAVVDSGYALHAPQTLALVRESLQGQPLDLLVNTHLHSDHCGGNAALQAHYPQLRTLVAPGHAAQVRQWDPVALGYVATGQLCPRFAVSDTLQPGTEVGLGEQRWQVHAAPGHDPHSLILFEPASRTLLSADALWERGFGVVFPELVGEPGFDEVAATLDLIESLQPAVVIPGHGAPFAGVTQALACARERLEGFASDITRHRQYAAKVLLKFKLLELQAVERSALQDWVDATPYFAPLLAQLYAGLDTRSAVDELLQSLVRAGAAQLQGSRVLNT